MRKSTAILTILAIALAAASLWMWHALGNERARADALEARIESMEPLAAGVLPDLALRTESAPAAAGAVVEGDAAQQPLDGKDLNAEESRLLQNESYREARRRFRQLEMARGHVDLAKVLGISQEKADRLIALLVERELHWQSQPFHNPRNEKELRIRQMENEQSQQEQDAQIATLIGADRLPKWKEYQASLPVRHEVNGLAARLHVDAEPLREAQVEPLISAIHADRQRVRRELTEFSESLVWTGGMEQESHRYRDERMAELLSTSKTRIHTAASSILSAKQLAVFDEMMRREYELDDAELQSRRAMFEAAQVSGGKN